MKELQWSQMRQEYERGTTYAKLAKIYGTSQATISRRAQLEGWGRRGSATHAGHLEQATEQLAALACRTLADPEQNISIKEMRELAALVRELTALREAARERQSEGGGTTTVRVMMEGDVEKWSK